MTERAEWIGAPEAFHLKNIACALNAAFGYHNYLVGSALTKRDYRDVDIRCILPDGVFDRLFPNCQIGFQHNSFWSLTCAAISEWLAKRTGLPIDFQIQRQSYANEHFPCPQHPRNALIIHGAADEDER